MNRTNIVYAGLAALVILVGLIVALRRRPRRINTRAVMEKWLNLQKSCADKKTWPQAVLDADKLLDDTLKRLRYKGKTPGERLVAAQHRLSNNESVWFGHKLRNKISDDGLKKISKQDTLEALSGFRQALKDLGAIRDKPVVPPSETEDRRA